MLNTLILASPNFNLDSNPRIFRLKIKLINQANGSTILGLYLTKNLNHIIKQNLKKPIVV